MGERWFFSTSRQKTPHTPCTSLFPLNLWLSTLVFLTLITYPYILLFGTGSYYIALASLELINFISGEYTTLPYPSLTWKLPIIHFKTIKIPVISNWKADNSSFQTVFLSFQGLGFLSSILPPNSNFLKKSSHASKASFKLAM